MRASLVLACATLISGCHSSDPCSGYNGTCVALTVQGSASTQVDRLAVSSSGLLVAMAASSIPASKSLPVQIALHLPNDISGSLALHAEGFLGSTVVGAGDTAVDVTPNKHTTAQLLLGDVGGQPDMASDEDLTGADLTPEPPDLTPPPDLTGTICTPNTVTMCADATTLELCSSDGFSHVTRDCPNGCTGAADLSHCKMPTVTMPLTGADFAPAGTAATTLPMGKTIYLDSDTGLIKTQEATPVVLRTANGNADVLETNNNIGFRRVATMGIFSFGDLTLPNGSTLWLTGSRMVGITSSGAIQIIGVVEGRALDVAAGSYCGKALAGAGGGAGGLTSGAGVPSAGTGTGAGQAAFSSGNTGGPAGGGASHGGKGGDGGNAHYSGGSLAGGPGGTQFGSETGPIHAGSGGASGSNGPGGNGSNAGWGGGGGGAVQIVAAVQITVGGGGSTGGVNVGGCGGSGGTAASSHGGGGGGGGAGGMVLLEAPTVTVMANGLLAANGGGGGGGSSPTVSGGGGNAGYLATFAAGGGSGATSCTSCGAGGAGSSSSVVNGIAGGIQGSTTLVEGGGGGGGGAGFIRINSEVALATYAASPAFGTMSSTGHNLASAGTLMVK